MDTIEKIIIGAWLLVFLLVVSFWGTIGYLAIHFISKFW